MIIAGARQGLRGVPSGVVQRPWQLQRRGCGRRRMLWQKEEMGAAEEAGNKAGKRGGEHRGERGDTRGGDGPARADADGRQHAVSRLLAGAPEPPFRRARDQASAGHSRSSAARHRALHQWRCALGCAAPRRCISPWSAAGRRWPSWPICWHTIPSTWWSAQSSRRSSRRRRHRSQSAWWRCAGCVWG